MNPYPTRSTGISTLDNLTGGYPLGKIVEIHGPASCGKTSVAFAAIKAVQRNLGQAVLFDFSGSVNYKYARACGIDFLHARLAIYEPEGFENLGAINSYPKASLIVLKLGPVVDKRALSNILPRVSTWLEATSATMLVLNQVTLSTEGASNSPLALRYAAIQRIRLEKVRTEVNLNLADGNHTPVGDVIRATLVKDLCGDQQGNTAEFYIKFGTGAWGSKEEACRTIPTRFEREYLI
jgi:hypothetical protein